MKMRFLLPVLATGFILAGCESNAIKEPTYTDAKNNQFIPTNREAADVLVAQLGNRVTAPNTLIIASLVNVDKLEESSTLGRIVAEQVSAGFTKHGFRMQELKLRSNIYVQNNGGEFLLTREVEELAEAHRAPAVVVGSYATSREFVYINLKVIHPKSNVVLAVHDYALPLDSNNRRMLRN